MPRRTKSPAEIPVAKGRRRHGAVEELTLVIVDTQEVAEKEGLVLPDRPANIGAIVVVDARGLRDRLEKRDGSKSAYAVVFIGGAVKSIGARLKDDVGDCAVGSPQFRVVIAGGHIHGFYCFDGRNVDRKQTSTLVVVQSFEFQIVGEAGLPIHLGPKAVLGVEEGGVLTVRPGRPRHQIEQTLEIPVETQRNSFDLQFFNLSSGIGAVGLQNRGLGTDYHGFACRAWLQYEVYAYVTVHQDIDSRPHDFLEALMVDGNFVLTRRKVAKLIVSAVVCCGAAANPGLCLHYRNACTAHYGAAGIGHGP